jgi:F-type H+-transporting ATPase subunit delta
MRESTVSRNYAEVLVALAEKERKKDLDRWGVLIDHVAQSITGDARLRSFLANPRITAAQKSKIVEQAFAKRLPPRMVAFLRALIMHRRQHLLADIAVEYHALVDEIAGRAHVQVQLVAAPDEATRAVVAKELSRITGLTVVPHFTIQPRILGGIIARLGDTVMDGSLARKLATLRVHMLGSAAR